MLSILISLLLLLVFFAIFWWILSMIPVPAEFVWVVRVVVAIIFLIALVSLLFGGWSLPLGHLGTIR